MSENERSFEQRLQSHFQNRFGEEWTPQKTVESFSLYGPQQRAEALDQLDHEMAKGGDIDNNPQAMTTAATRLELKRQLQSLHQRMLAVRR